jgi:hypothetical protein
MALHLVVRQPFGDRKRGDKITDPAEVAAVLESENEPHVVRVNAPEPEGA